MSIPGVQDIPAKNWLLSQRNTSFLGLRVMQRWVDFLVWEKLLNRYDEIVCIVELGTFNGAFSTYLYLQALQRGMHFYTYDKDDYASVSDAPVAKQLGLGGHFWHMDIFKNGSEDLQRVLRCPPLHPMILFCDNGNKTKEFKTFAPMLSQGDIIGVHDWTEEFGPIDAASMKHILRPIFSEECTAVNSITRFWMRA